MIKTESLDKVEVKSTQELREWLENNYSQKTSVWLVTYKKNMGEIYVSVQDILDEVLCFGWIDGIRRKLDEQRTMQMISPRQAQHWAKSYKDRVAKLIKEGRMHPAGLAAIAESKRRGLWNFMDDVDALILPEDLLEAFKVHPLSYENFAAFNPSSKRNILRWIKLAKAPETRAKRIQKTVNLAAKNKKVQGM